MRIAIAALVALIGASPVLADPSVFVPGAFNGRWGASFPPFIPQIIGPINFQQIDEAEGMAKMMELRGADIVDDLCPPQGEKREFYGGDYDYQRRGEVYACTNGTTLHGVYRDFPGGGGDSGSITIDETFPDDSPPNWKGSFFSIPQGEGSAMHGQYQGNGIATPLARGGDQPPVTSLSGAGYSSVNGFAPESFVALFGQNLADELLVDGNLPTSLGGLSIAITDSAGTMHQAGIYVVSPTQVNYLLPEGMAEGLAQLTVLRDDEVIGVETIEIAAVSPGIFSAAGNGQGPAAATWLRVNPDGTRDSGLTFDTALAAVPLDFGPLGGDLYVSLFLTGTRNFSGSVTVTVDGISVPFSGPAAQGEFDGLDQLNLGPLPRELAGRGEVEVVVTVDGKQANIVTLAFL